MKYKNALVGIIFFIGCGLIGIHAQEAVLIAGGDASGSGGSSSYSIGQILFHTCTGTTGCSVGCDVLWPGGYRDHRHHQHRRSLR